MFHWLEKDGAPIQEVDETISYRENVAFLVDSWVGHHVCEVLVLETNLEIW